MEYWKQRQSQLQSQLEKDEEILKKKLSNSYDAQSSKLEKQIAHYYQEYGEDNVIQYRKLMEQLPDSDKKLLIENIDNFTNKYPQYQHLVPVRTSIYKLNRIEGMQQSIYMQQMEMGATDQEMLEKHLADVARRSGQNMADMMGFGSKFYTVNPDIVSKTINSKWCNGKNFSDSIWSNRQKLADYLNSDFGQAMARGDSYQRCIKNLGDRFSNVSRRDMFRLVYTEGTYVMNEAAITPFEEDFEEYEFSTVGDGKVCSICTRLSGSGIKFKMKDRRPGINFPPMHSCCRCSFTIVIPKNFVDDYVDRHGGASIAMPNGLRKLIDGEQESSARRNRDTTCAVKWNVVNAADYLDKIKKISNNDKVVDSIYTRSRWALRNRDGLNTEELYALNLSDGSEIGKIVSQQNPFGVERTSSFNKKLVTSDKRGDEVLLLHNHPRGLPPSLGDINVLYGTKNVSGITVGHDGSIYYYTRPAVKIPDIDYLVASRKFREYSEVEGQEMALDYLAEKFGFSFRKL